MQDNGSSTRPDAHRTTLGRRGFLGASIGAVVGGMAAQTLPLSAQQPSGTTDPFFPGFQRKRIEASGTSINLVVGGSGPPVLLLHGYPTTHLMWQKVAVGLAKDFTVVAADLRGLR